MATEPLAPFAEFTPKAIIKSADVNEVIEALRTGINTHGHAAEEVEGGVFGTGAFTFPGNVTILGNLYVSGTGGGGGGTPDAYRWPDGALPRGKAVGTYDIDITGSCLYAQGAGLATQAYDSDKLQGQNGAYYRNADNLASGTLADARLSANVPRLNASQTFSGTQTFSGPVTFTGTVSGIVAAAGRPLLPPTYVSQNGGSYTIAASSCLVQVYDSYATMPSLKVPWAVAEGTVFVLYNSSTGKTCSVTIQDTFARPFCGVPSARGGDAFFRTNTYVLNPGECIRLTRVSDAFLVW